MLKRFDELSAVFVAHSTTRHVSKGKVTHAEDKNTTGWDAQRSSLKRGGGVSQHGQEADESRTSITSTVRNLASGTSITIHASQNLSAVESHVSVQTTNVVEYFGSNALPQVVMNFDLTCIRASAVDTTNTGVDISSVKELIVTSVIWNESAFARCPAAATPE